MAATPIQFNDQEDLNAKVHIIDLKLMTAPDQDPFSSVFFSKESLEALLDNPGSVGIRFYPALRNVGESQYITLLATSEGISNNESVIKGDIALLANDICPPDCPRTRKMDALTNMNVTPA